MTTDYTQSLLASEFFGEAVRQLRPDSLWELIHSNPSKFIWDPQNTAHPPTSDELAAAVAQLKSADMAVAYKAQRLKEYPPLEDFVDAYYWSQRGDDSLMQAYLAKIDEIKAHYPKGAAKPEGGALQATAATLPTKADEFFTKLVAGASRADLQKLIDEKLPGQDFSQFKPLSVLREAVALALTIELKQNGKV